MAPRPRTRRTVTGSRPGPPRYRGSSRVETWLVHAPNNPWLGAIFGGQKDDWDFHTAGFTEPWLAYVLGLAGFSDIKRVDHFDEVGIADTSYSPYPFGRNISLNMMAFNGDAPALSLPAWSATERCLAAAGKGLELAMRARSAAQSRLALRRLARNAGSDR